MSTASSRRLKGALRWLARVLLPLGLESKVLGLWRRAYWWHRSRINVRRNRRIIRKVVASPGPVKLELGSPRRSELPDWIASDINGSGDIQLDLTQSIPFPDCSVDELYMSHLLEHFSYPNPMRGLLAECNRILKPKGMLGVAVPNARIFLNAYSLQSDFDWRKYCTEEVGLKYSSKIDYVNFVAYLGGQHKHLFDEDNLVLVLIEAGFKRVSIREYDSSIDLARRRHESIYAVAHK